MSEVKDPPKLRMLSFDNCQSYLDCECHSSLNEFIALEEAENTNQMEHKAQLSNPLKPLYTTHGNPVRMFLLFLLLPEDLHHSTECTLKDLLMPDCKIEDIRIDIPYALVSVLSYEQATKSLISTLLASHNIKVTLAGSYYPAENYKCSSYTISAQEQALPKDPVAVIFDLLKLTDDCLLYFFNFLHLIDLIKMESCSSRLDSLILLYYNHKYKSIDIRYYSTNDKRNVLESMLAGRVEELHFSSIPCQPCRDNDFLYQLIIKNCKNLRVLKLQDSHVPLKFLQQLAVDELEVLKIDNRGLKISVSDISESQMFPKLHTLVLKGVENMTHDLFTNLKNIRTVLVRNSSSDSLDYFLRNNATTINYLSVSHPAMVRLRKVKDLVLTPDNMEQDLNCYSFLDSIRHLTIDFRCCARDFSKDPVDLKKLLEPFAEMNNLEILQIFMNEFEAKAIDGIQQALKKFSKLKRFAIDQEFVVDIILDLVRSNPELETVSLPFVRLSLDLVIAIIQSTRKLRVLDLMFNSRIETSCIPLLIEALGRRPIEAKRRRLTVYAYLCFLDEGCLKSENYLVNRDILKIETTRFPDYLEDISTL